MFLFSVTCHAPHPFVVAAYFVIYNVNFFDFCQVRAHLINGNKTQQAAKAAKGCGNEQQERRREWDKESGGRVGGVVQEREEYVVGANKRGRGQSKYKYKAYKFNSALANKNQ